MTKRRPVAATAIVALLAAAATTIVALRYGSRVAGGSDSYGYVSQAQLWREHSFLVRDPIFAASPWPFALETWTPLGYAPGPHRDGIVPAYPPGLPLVMAAAQLVGGYCSAFLVTPIAAGVCVLATYLLGARVLGRRAPALSAALLLACTPVFLYQSMAPMSDVPATAAWTVALLFAVVNRPLAAGLTMSVAAAIRPNLVVMAAPIAIWLATDRRAVAWLAAGLTPSLIAIPAFNAYVYGSPLVSGYGRPSDLYSIQYVGTNVRQFVSWAAAGQTPLIFAGTLFLAAPGAFGGAAISRPRLLLGGVIAAVVASYLFYFPFPAWWFLRFLLPMWPVLLIATAAVLHAIASRWSPGIRRLLPAAVIAALCLWGIRFAVTRYAFDLWRGDRRFVDIAQYIRDYTEPNSVVLAFQHSGSVRHYAGRLTLRWDILEPRRLDQAIAFLEAQGRHPYLLLDGEEVPQFKARFGSASRLGLLHAQPVAMVERPDVFLYDALDRGPHTPDVVRNTGVGEVRWRCDESRPWRSAQNLQH